MEEKSQKERNIILATIGMLVLNILLSITLTNVTPDQTGTQTTSWNEILIYARQLSVLLYVVWLLTLFGKTANIGKRIISFTMTHMNVIFLCVIFVYLVLYEMYTAYFADYGISPDSTNYMREASALLSGNGFHVNKAAGYGDWFAKWPIGYPVLIALSTFISHRSIYLSSKLLSISLVGFGLVVLYLRFKKDAWIYSLIYLNIGFLKIYKFTWSENPFILSLIIWGIALSVIVEEEKPKKRWYIITILGILGAFLSRYFGIVTILFTGLCLLGYILYFWLKNRDKGVLSKIIGLFIVEASSSILSVTYLLTNRINAGAISGIDRTCWWDDYNELINNLYNALMSEIFNATRIAVDSLMPDFKPQGRAAIILLLLVILILILIKNYQKEKKLDYKTVFIGAGIFYYFVFIVVRFYSSMDGFGYRFFAPAGMMVSIGILGLIKDKFGEGLKKIQLGMCLFLFILCGGIIQNIKYYTIEPGAFHILYNQAMEQVAPIPPKGMILNYDGHSQLYAFRTDIMIDAQIAYDDTMETIISKYGGSESFWIRRDVLNAIVNDDKYSAEIRNTFAQYVVDGANGDEYIQVY